MPKRKPKRPWWQIWKIRPYLKFKKFGKLKDYEGGFNVTFKFN